MNKDGMYLKVGLVVILCACAGIVVLIKVGKIKERFSARQIVDVTFANAQGLKRGAPVLYSGVHIGTVEEVVVERRPSSDDSEKIRDQSPFHVRIRLDVKDSPEMPITYDDTVTIYVPLAMGEPDVRIVPMDGKRIYQPNRPIQGASREDMTEMVSGSMGEMVPLIRNLRITSDKLRQIATDEQGVIGVLTSKDAADELKATLYDLRTLAKTVRSLGIADFLADNKIADRIVTKWWGDNVTRNMSTEEAFARWKSFVQDQKATDHTLLYMDPKYPDGCPWKQKELREWKHMTESNE